MIDYIKEGLEYGYAPPVIYKNICKALEDTTLSEEDRNELLRQKEKAKDLAIKMSGIFEFKIDE